MLVYHVPEFVIPPWGPAGNRRKLRASSPVRVRLEVEAGPDGDRDEREHERMVEGGRTTKRAA